MDEIDIYYIRFINSVDKLNYKDYWDYLISHIDHWFRNNAFSYKHFTK